MFPPIQEGTPTMAHHFSEEEYKNGIAALKNNKAAGRNDVLVKQLKQLGQKANKWLHTMLNVCFTGNKIPKILRQSQISVILKTGRLRDSEELQTNLPLMPYILTLRTNDSKQNSYSSRIILNQETSQLQEQEVMHQPTIFTHFQNTI